MIKHERYPNELKEGHLYWIEESPDEKLSNQFSFRYKGKVLSLKLILEGAEFNTSTFAANINPIIFKVVKVYDECTFKIVLLHEHKTEKWEEYNSTGYHEGFNISLCDLGFDARLDIKLLGNSQITTPKATLNYSLEIIKEISPRYISTFKLKDIK